jgi:mono/diheme cytochrome c family protein
MFLQMMVNLRTRSFPVMDRGRHLVGMTVTDAMRKALVLAVGMAIPATALCQQIGDAEEGFRYASETCSGCHAVRRDQLLSPYGGAARFVDIANTPGMTAIALAAALQTSHETMPNIIIGDADMANVIQYILSLKEE